MASTCGKPAAGKFYYVDRNGDEHQGQHLCTAHARALTATKEVEGTARTSTVPDEAATCEHSSSGED